MTAEPLSAPTLLFVPGHRPDRFGKAAAAAPEGIVLDLEDAVPPAEKGEARVAVAAWLAGPRGQTPAFVRINALGTAEALEDLAWLADGRLSPDGIVMAKVEAARDIEILRALLPAPVPVLAAVETARGILRAETIAAALRPSDALGFGGADLAADLGAEFAWEPLSFARARLVAAAAAAGVHVFDVPHLSIGDAEALASETRRARALGFTGKLAIHPAQVAVITAAFAPSPDAVVQARRVIAALDAARGGIARLDGKMIDAPVARAARRILARLADSHDKEAS